MSRRIELWASVQELNEQGEYSHVELVPGKDVSTGGVFQLRQVWEITLKVLLFFLVLPLVPRCCLIRHQVTLGVLKGNSKLNVLLLLLLLIAFT